jgi:hypothetical protein
MKTMFGLLLSAACAAVAMNATSRVTAHCLSMFGFGFIFCFSFSKHAWSTTLALPVSRSGE